MEGKVKLDLSGISLIKRVELGATAVGTIDSGPGPENTLPKVVKPKERSPDYLLNAIQRKNKSIQERLAELPDAPSPADYRDLPVGKFGDAALRGMSWNAGLRSASPREAIQFVPLPEGVGLGYNSDTCTSKNGRPVFIRPNGRGIVGVSEGLQVVEELQRGSPVCIVRGLHCGLTGVLTEKGNGDRVSVRLDISGVRVKVGLGAVARPGTKKSETHAKLGPDLRFPGGSVCRTIRRNENYYQTVVVVQQDPLTVLRDKRTITGLVHSDLAIVDVGLEDRVVCLDYEHYGKTGRCIGVSNDHATVLLDDMQAVRMSPDFLTLYKDS